MRVAAIAMALPHRTSYVHAVAVVFSLGLTAIPVLAQRPYVVIGTVVDSASDAPLAYADIWLTRNGRIAAERYATTDAGGRFRILADGKGELGIFVKRMGYASTSAPLRRVDRSDSLTLAIHLAPLAVALPGATVTGRDGSRDQLLSGFDRRRELGLGAFITYDEIQQMGEPSLPDLLREIPGVTVKGNGPHVEVQMDRSLALRRCEPLIYMDGQRATHSTDAPNIVGDLLAGTPGSSLEAVEVYRGRSELPAEFADPDARCGVIVIWTHRPALHERGPGGVRRR